MDFAVGGVAACGAGFFTNPMDVRQAMTHSRIAIEIVRYNLIFVGH